MPTTTEDSENCKEMTTDDGRGVVMTVIGHGILAGKYLAEYRDLLK